jgi:hypothetical protein
VAVLAVVRHVVVAMIVLAATPAQADDSLFNYSVGPVFGVRLSGSKLSGPDGHRGVVGIEGGLGFGPERINIGFEHRADHDAGYIEFDPWYIIGGTLGVAVDDENNASGVFGVWEGLPVAGFDNCPDGWHNRVTVAGGYRYTGVHELFVTVKAGRMNGNFCLGVND